MHDAFLEAVQKNFFKCRLNLPTLTHFIFSTKTKNNNNNNNSLTLRGLGPWGFPD
jgi:hypothetical protein